MAEPIKREITPDWDSIGGQLTAGLLRVLFESKAGDWVGTNVTEAASQILAALFKAMGPIGTGLARGIADAEDEAAPILSEMAATAASDLFGRPVPASAFKRRGGGGVSRDVGTVLGAGFLDTIKTQAGGVEPSAEPAARFLGMIINLALEGWYQGFTFEFLSSLVPYFDIGKLESFAELDDTLAQALGLGRLSRRVIGPYIDALVTTPLEWSVNKTYHPRLLGVGEAVRMWTSGRWSQEQLVEELERQGYDMNRILGLINSAVKGLSPADADLLVRAGIWTEDEALQTLRTDGYDEPGARARLRVEWLQRVAAFERTLATAAIDAFADGRIDERVLRESLKGVTIDQRERNQMAEIAIARRALRVKPLTSSEARRLAEKEILSVADYRRALEREGRDLEAIAALELELRQDIRVDHDLAAARAEQAAERAAEAQARADEQAKRKADAESERARARRGPLGTLERLVARGRIPVAHYAEVLAAQYDPDVVAALVADAEAARERYLEDAQRRQDALQRAERRNLNVGAIEQAYLEGILTIDEFRRHPSVAALDPPDVEILVRTLEARKRDLDAARQRRADLADEAAAAQIPLGTLEALVLRGIRTLDDYATRLRTVPFAEEDVAALVELLELRLEEAARAQAERAAAEARLRTRGLSLEQLRRAVLRGVATPEAFDRFLETEGFSVDARATLMAELRAELEEADAARRRKDEAEATRGSRELPLGTVERAARLGVITPTDYRARLVALGLDELDVQIVVDLLLLDITETQQARARRTTIDAEPALEGLTFGELARAVKAGIKDLEDYRGALVARGKDADTVATLVALLEDEVSQRKHALERRARIAERLAGAGVDLDALEREVLEGLRSLDRYVAALLPLGVLPVETGLLVGLLVEQLEAAAASLPPTTA